MIKPLQIGSLIFKHNLIQGPLAGYSCAPFRKLFYQFTPPAYCVTEMISALDLTRNKNLRSRYVWRDPAEKYLCYQLSGNCPTTLRTATTIVTDLGADLIDLNSGCPKQKIRKKKCGSYLLTLPELLGELIATMKTATQVPVTVKIRIDNQGDSHFKVAQIVEQAGADALIVHGRHWSENYDIPCRQNIIHEIASAASIPVIGNGDVHDIMSLKAMLKTGVAGVMISRACTGKPWLFQQLLQESKGENFYIPNLDNITLLFSQHIASLTELEGSHKALLQSRKLIPYYFRDYLNAGQLSLLLQGQEQDLISAISTALDIHQ